ncbi:MAG: AsmA family protein [Nitrospira sp.]|nr:AsmA family protein [Nitrospira sp.]
MSKTIKGVIIGIPVIIVAVLVVFYFSFNSIVKNGVEAIGPKVLGADVVLEQVNISLLSGKGQLKGIMVGNPEGFQTESAFKLGEVKVAVDVFSVLSNKIVIDEIVIDSPEITYETSGGKNNIEALLENINDFVGTSKDSTAESKENASQESGKKVQINDFILSNAKVNLSATLLQGKKITVPMADIHLEDIGKDDEGASMSDAFKEIFAELNKNIAGAVAAPLKSTGETVEKTVDKIKGLFGK